MKVVLRPSWQSKAYGKNVVRSVMNGSHYTRSLKGIILLNECIERFQWVEFFKTTGIKPYRNELESLKMMKKYVARKNRDESKL